MASFVASERGAAFEAVCRRYGRSPGAVLFPDDDVSAYDVDLAFVIVERPEEEPNLVTVPNADIDAHIEAMLGG